MKWINVRISGMKATVMCPKCRAAFYLDARSLKDKNHRRRWKCCPICETKIDGYVLHAPRTHEAAADEEGQGGRP